MSDDLKLPDVGELTLPRWQYWLARYNEVLGERERRIEKLEERVKELELIQDCACPYDNPTDACASYKRLFDRVWPVPYQAADRIEKLEAALREIGNGPTCCPVSNAMRDIACKALEGKDE